MDGKKERFLVAFLFLSLLGFFLTPRVFCRLLWFFLLFFFLFFSPGLDPIIESKMAGALIAANAAPGRRSAAGELGPKEELSSSSSSITGRPGEGVDYSRAILAVKKREEGGGGGGGEGEQGGEASSSSSAAAALRQNKKTELNDEEVEAALLDAGLTSQEVTAYHSWSMRIGQFLAFCIDEGVLGYKFSLADLSEAIGLVDGAADRVSSREKEKRSRRTVRQTERGVEREKEMKRLERNKERKEKRERDVFLLFGTVQREEEERGGCSLFFVASWRKERRVEESLLLRLL